MVRLRDAVVRLRAPLERLRAVDPLRAVERGFALALRCVRRLELDPLADLPRCALSLRTACSSFRRSSRAFFILRSRSLCNL